MEAEELGSGAYEREGVEPRRERWWSLGERGWGLGERGGGA